MHNSNPIVRSLVVSAIGLFLGALHAQDPFAPGVRTTEPLTAEQASETFQLPPGFKIQLFSAEPEIAKPMNMAFDAEGRLWTTVTLEYPFPLPPDQAGRDSIKILEDTNGDGRADKVTTFVDGLNIPTGILPTQDGCIAWSIPYIWRFYDDDGDARADRKERLYGPLGWERDTHGMNSSFRRGLDGWIYATHGFNNQSAIRGTDGSLLDIQSGNTYRIRDNGQRVEPFAFGQVNPFGLTFDDRGFLYSADCHSAPIYQLVPGGFYPSFGKPHDGLGFGPVLMQHSHGSTAIAGIVYCEDPTWPEEFQNNIFVGNVMTSRINRDRIRFNGSSPEAEEMDDFLKTTDPWFRPVDLQWGPDGALYVADFYNRIIGHYEVPLDHPGRDRFRGRIWRISYDGDRRSGDAPGDSNLNANGDSIEKWIAELDHANRVRRSLATQHLVDHFGANAVSKLQGVLKRPNVSAQGKIHAAWALAQLNALTPTLLSDLCESQRDLERIHGLRMVGEASLDRLFSNRLISQGLQDKSPFVQRAAVEAASKRPDPSLILPLLGALRTTPTEDDHLVYHIKVGLREQCELPGALSHSMSRLDPLSAGVIAEICPAIPSAESSSFLIQYLETNTPSRSRAIEYLKHASRFIVPGKEADLIGLAERYGDLSLQGDLFNAVRQGLTASGKPIPSAVIEWGERLVNGLILELRDSAASNWQFNPVNRARDVNPWFLQKRVSADGNRQSLFLCSLPPGGESWTGSLRSPVFQAPETLSFWLAGHDGFPDQPRKKLNRVELIEAATGNRLATSYAPRDDVAQKVEWNLKPFLHREVYLELTDADTGSAYAWLALGRIEPPIVGLPKWDPGEVTRRWTMAVTMASDLELKVFEPVFSGLLEASSTDGTARSLLMEVLADWKDLPVIKGLAALDSLTGSLPEAARVRMAAELLRPETNPSETGLSLLNYLSFQQQQEFAVLTAGNPSGATLVLEAVEDGRLSRDILHSRRLGSLMESNLDDASQARFNGIRNGLDDSGSILLKAIKERLDHFSPSPDSISRGAELFQANCANCHRIKGSGGLVGPQLDGIGNRGLARLAEDVLDPNRNIDTAFKTVLVVTKDGDVESGLPRRDEGELLILANSVGTEFAVEKASIKEVRQTDLSLMPENFSEILSQEGFNHLMQFLLDQTN